MTNPTPFCDLDALYAVIVGECIRHELNVAPTQSSNLGQRQCVPDGSAARIFDGADALFSEYQRREARSRREKQLA